MFLQGKAQKVLQLRSIRHWDKCYLTDDGLWKADCTDILHRRGSNWRMNLLSNNLWDTLEVAVHDLCTSDQEDKLSSWWTPSDLGSILRHMGRDFLMDRRKSIQRGKQSKIRHRQVKKNQGGTLVQRHWEFCRHIQPDKQNSLMRLE
jgi:hypothetical protein